MSIALPYGSRRESRWSRFMASSLTRSFMIGASFAILINFGLYSGRDLADMLGAAMSRGPSINGTAQGVGDTGRSANDPALQFLETRVGQLLISVNDSDTCRKMLFDNRTGEATDAGRVQCGLLHEAQQEAMRLEQSRERTQQVLKSFRRP